jgi:hypothetical protein
MHRMSRPWFWFPGSGSLLLSVAVVSVAMRFLVVVVRKTSDREWPLCLVLCALLGVVPTVAEGFIC